MYTGNMLIYKRNSSAISVYPCVYREHLCQTLNNFQFFRFIPVYTGNIFDRTLAHSWSPVYPCVYREHFWCCDLHVSFCGLSLCIQGTFFHEIITNYEYRFIPVYTGNIQFLIKPKVQATVYPCVYREHIIYYLVANLNLGLSLCIQGTYQL